ncbi:DUF4199 domain-containing protein [Phenylobacterium sp.]|uniref:DUF4199 domain-containing protein n=1 Tax=Phenylobacterium sp. TaxID=1871053 RepID=UPI0011FCA14C|nr:DUF4199 domain-containing protein [Phenylobacterium sp.]THD57955.1 MAG: DUF4199 domain-containing protein [Phenylobacterium sp.]
MIRIILTYGLISGLVIILGIMFTMFTVGDHGGASLWLGYLIMLVALSSILVGVRQHRDQALGGVIRFRTALMVGLGIALVASVAYVLIWEVYLAATHYSFMDKYVASMLSAKRAAGVTGAAYAKAVAEAETMRRQYANPLHRLPETFLEIFPVGLVIALVSAALLRNPRFLPARIRMVAA